MKVVIRHFHLLLLLLFRKRQIQGNETDEFDDLIAEDSETNQNESGNQALSLSSSPPLSQTTNPRE